MIIGSSKAFEFSADFKQNRPQGDFYQVRREGEGYRQYNNCKIHNQGQAGPAMFTFVTEEVHRRAHSQRMDEDCAQDSDSADCQWFRDGNLLDWSHPVARILPSYRGEEVGTPLPRLR